MYYTFIQRRYKSVTFLGKELEKVPCMCQKMELDISDTVERDLVIKAATRLELELRDSDVDTSDEDETLSRDLSRQVMSNNTLF